MTNRTNTVWVLVLLIGALMSLQACGGGSDGPVQGINVYSQSVAGGNPFACATCHAISEPAADGFRRPGHPIGDATRRPTYKNGQLTELREAVNTCLVEWMAADPWSATDERWIALESYLDAQATELTAPAIVIERVDPPNVLTGGDASDGRSTFNETCTVCHGNNGVGSPLAPGFVGSFGQTDSNIARRVRTSGSTGSSVYPGLTGGRMPFWGADRLSDDELRDVIAYVLDLSTMPADGGVDGGSSDALVFGTPRNCGATSPKVDVTGSFRTLAHGVSGTARVVDDCTIEITNFVYDGTGPVVYFYGGPKASGVGLVDYNQMNPNIFRWVDEKFVNGRVYEGETLRVHLEAERTIDDFDCLTVWCEQFHVNFGDVCF